MNIYKGKLFSIMGDSISTLDGYNPKGFPVYYKYEKKARNGVNHPLDTWWGKVISHFDGELLVNSSWSGGYVSKVPSWDKVFPSACSYERIDSLSADEKSPEVVLVYIGTNDWARGSRKETGNPLEYFFSAYVAMLERIKERYPLAEVFCLSLNETCIPGLPAIKFDYVIGDDHIERYNQDIKEACLQTGCRFVDIYSRHVPYSTRDSAHPDRRGMQTIAQLCIDEMERIINREDNIS